MATTLLLDRSAWDLSIDAAGNIALAAEPYSQVQDTASAARVYEGEAWYDTTLGVPYDTQILGQYQPTQVLQARLEQAAQTVPGVTEARAIIGGLSGRSLSGQLQIKVGTEQLVVDL